MPCDILRMLVRFDMRVAEEVPRVLAPRKTGGETPPSQGPSQARNLENAFKPFAFAPRPRGCRSGEFPRSGEVHRVTTGRPPILDLEEARLIAGLRRGDAHALEGLYRRHGGRVYALALRLTGDSGRAEEVVQDVFLQVWRRIDSFEGRSRFSTWLHRLAVNRSLDALRRESGRKTEEIPQESDRHRLFQKETAMEATLDLEAAIASLPDGARMVFVLHDVEGYGHEEIATLSGIATGTSKAQLFRARRLLRERLGRTAREGAGL